MILPGMMPTDMLSEATDEEKTFDRLSPELQQVCINLASFLMNRFSFKVYGDFYSADAISYRKKVIYSSTHEVSEVSHAVLHALTALVPRTIYYLGTPTFYSIPSDPWED
jgi:hypothetical protein